jgi:hypothetical protein
MIYFRCPNCRKGGYVEGPKVRCSCGKSYSGDELAAACDARTIQESRTVELPCIYRGPEIRKIDCGCEGNAMLYHCERHERCLIRPLLKSTYRGQTCETCGDRVDVDTATEIATYHFNTHNRERLRANYAHWAAKLGRRHTCYEVGNRGQEIAASVYLRSDQAIWQKERLINLALASVGPHVRYFAWIDHDLLFERSDWLEIGADLINRGADCVQLFDIVAYYDRDGNKIEDRAGSVASWQRRGKIDNTAPGGAWIASVAWLRSIGGVYDRNICGGGDATFFEAVTGARTNYVERQTRHLRDDCQKYVRHVNGASVAFVPGTVRHLWHGDREHRQYVSRDEILARHDFDPQRDLAIADFGLYKLRDPFGRLAADIWQYFADRRDDG